MSDRCIYCGGNAERWCDLVIGFTDPDGDGLFSFADGSENLHCNAPLCIRHTSFQGNMFICGDAAYAGADSVDYCVGHKAREVFEPMTQDEAERVRYKHKCKAAGLRRVLVDQIG